MKKMYNNRPNAIYDECLNGYELIQYNDNGNRDGDWWHNEQCPWLGCLPAPKDQLDLKELEFIDGAWRSVELYQECLEEGYTDKKWTWVNEVRSKKNIAPLDQQ